MAPYHILIVITSSVIPENLVLFTKSEQSGPKSAHIRPTIGSLSNDDADGNENGYPFLYISLPSLPDYNVKMPEFMFCRGRGHKTTTFFSFPEL